jgi:hypothetical protein
VQLSDGYYRRLTIHRIGSYTVIPIFTAQYIAGSRLYDQGSAAPGWARPTHKIGAAALAGVFTVNTVTGVWNLWESRHIPERRVLRFAHALSMLGADAAFAYTGIKLSQDAENSMVARRRHRNVALTSIGVSTVSGLAMWIANR